MKQERDKERIAYERSQIIFNNTFTTLNDVLNEKEKKLRRISVDQHKRNMARVEKAIESNKRMKRALDHYKESEREMEQIGRAHV